MPVDEVLHSLSIQFNELQSNLQWFLNPSDSLKTSTLVSTKSLYDSLKQVERGTLNKSRAKTLSTRTSQVLLTKDFDNEQVWQQIQLQNKFQLKQMRSTILKTVTGMKSDSNKSDDDEDNDSYLMNGENGSNEENDGDVDVDEDHLDNYDEHNKDNARMYKSTVVDDKFFRLREMEEFLDNQDRLYNTRNEMDNTQSKNGNEEMDLFDEDMFDSTEEHDEHESLMYTDFFDPPVNEKFDDVKSKQKKRKKEDNVETNTTENLHESENEGDNETNKNEESEERSRFERKQEQVKEHITRLEESNITKKPWQLMGESTGTSRPLNSLLEEHVTFDHTSVGAPVITEKTTQTLEDLIRLRIRDQAWDDVERKEKPRMEAHEYKRASELNMEKSKLSLAEVYEQEYLKQIDGADEEKENEEHVVIKNLTQKLFVKLDALSNFLYTPKPPKPELKIISNAPSLEMEEVTPITMTDASQLAPEEVYNKKKCDVSGDTEKTKEDKNRERRNKKIKKKFAAKEQERKERLKANVKSKSTKKKAVEQLKKGVRNTIIKEQPQNLTKTNAPKSSSAFFSQLQDEVKSNISKQRAKNHPDHRKNKQSSVQSFKL